MIEAESRHPVLSVVIPARNAAATIGRTLESIAAQDLGAPFEVIVVDDGSEDDTVRVVESSPLEVTLLKQREGLAGKARNLGAAHSSAPVLAFTDADCFPDPAWLRHGLAEIADVDLVQGAVQSDRTVTGGMLDRSIWVDRERGLFETANLFVKREAFERVGGFEDWLFTPRGMTFAEDTWFGWRVIRSQGSTRFAQSALVDHALVRRSALKYVQDQRNLVCVPAMVKRIPELRSALLLWRVFLTPRRARYDAALAGLVLAALTRTRLPLLAALPYARLVVGRALSQGRKAPIVLAADVAADTVVAAALAEGGLRSRALVL